MTTEQIDITDEALELVIDRTTREAGCARSRGRSPHRARRRREVAEGTATEKIVVRTENDIREYLGQTKFTSEWPSARRIRRRDGPRVDAGRRLDPVRRGDEDARKGKLTLTGQLGDVMKRARRPPSATVRATTIAFGIAKNFFDETDLHIHVPAERCPRMAERGRDAPHGARLSLTGSAPARVP